MSAEPIPGPNLEDELPRRLEWTPGLVERFWNGIAQTRLVESSFARTGGLSLLAVVDHLLTPRARILDFGAGDGDLVRAMCKRGLQAAAYEPSSQRAGNLRANLADVPGFLGEFGVDDFAEFDVVTMTEVIEHVLDSDLDACLQRVASMVKLGGLLIVTTPNNEDLDLSLVYCPVSNMLYHRWQHVRSFTPASLEALLVQHGFQPLVTHRLPFMQELYRPFDRLWGDGISEAKWPQYMHSLRANRATLIDPQTTLLYIGQRIF